MKPIRERNPIAVGVISVAALTVAMLFAFSLDRIPFLKNAYRVQADFADASGLVPENEVRVAGLKVGKVRSVDLAGDRVRVSMEISKDVKLGRGSTAEIKLKTLLGAKFVAVEPKGGAPYLKSGDTIPLDRTVIPFELYQVTNETVASLGKLDANALNDALRELAKLTDDPNGNFGRAFEGLSRATEAVAQRDAELESLLVNSDAILKTLAARSDQLAGILDAGATLLGKLGERRQALKAFVVGTDRASSQLAGLLKDTRSSLDPALRDLHTALQVVAANEVPVATWKGLSNLEEALRVLGPDSESFGRVFTQGTWADVFTQSVFTLPLPTGGGAPAARSSAASRQAGLAGLFGVRR